jgi:hypothetical protein
MPFLRSVVFALVFAVAGNLNGIGLSRLRPSIEAAGASPAATTDDRPISG